MLSFTVRYNMPFETAREFVTTDLGFMAGETYLLYEVLACNSAAHVELGPEREVNRTQAFYDVVLGGLSGNVTTIWSVFESDMV